MNILKGDRLRLGRRGSSACNIIVVQKTDSDYFEYTFEDETPADLLYRIEKVQPIPKFKKGQIVVSVHGNIPRPVMDAPTWSGLFWAYKLIDTGRTTEGFVIMGEDFLRAQTDEERGPSYA